MNNLDHKTDRELLLILLERMDKLPERVSTLEKWQAWIMGGLAVIGLLLIPVVIKFLAG